MADTMRFQPYNDIPSIDLPDDSPLMGENRTLPYDGYLDECWNPIDPTSGGAKSFHSFHPDRPELQMRLLHLEKSANGEINQPFYGPIGDKFSRSSVPQPWEPQDLYPNMDRTMRYISPSGPFGGNQSGTDPDSSQSECSYSPQTSRGYPQHFDGQHEYYQALHSPEEEHSCGNAFGNNWTNSYFPSSQNHASQAGSRSVALKELQRYPDLQEDAERFEDEDTIKVEGAYSHSAKMFADDASFHDETLGDSVNDDDSFDDDGCNEDSHSEYSPSKSIRLSSHVKRIPPKGLASRKQQPRNVKTQNDNRVSKSRHATMRQRGPQDKPSTATTKGKKKQKEGKAPLRPFVCSFSHYGCNSTFGSKNEWKRHVMSQHLQLGFYRCDVGSCDPDQGRSKQSGSRGHNDFNRKDLFTQHQRRMHCPWSPPTKPPSAQVKEEFEVGLEAVRQRCWQQQRDPPAKSVCGFCNRVFEGSSTWDERMEHVGKHFEKGDAEEREDEELREWALQQEIIIEVIPGRYRLAGKEDTLPNGVGDEDAEGEDE